MHVMYQKPMAVPYIILILPMSVAGGNVAVVQSIKVPTSPSVVTPGIGVR